MNKNFFCILTAFVFISAGCLSQVKNIGHIISYKKITGGIKGKTINAIFDIRAYNDNIIRIRISKEKNFRNFSYALTDNTMPLFNGITITEKDSSIFLSTKILKRQ